MKNNLKSIPQKVFDNSSIFQEHKFVYPYNKNNISTIFVEIMYLERKAIVILSQSPENEGMSVTNACEHIAIQVYNKYLLEYSPEQIIWIEHYPSEVYGTRNRKETYDQVLLQWNHKSKVFFGPQWKHLKSINDVQNLIND